jgi:hypothetical protein
MTTQILKYNDQEVEFEFNDTNVMVNATQMAKIFGKEVARFMENDSTKNFISACLKTRNSSFLNIEKEADVYVSKQKSGTFMHRILALKFAAWLDPDFEVWVYATIDCLLFEHYRQLEDSLKASADRRNRIHELKNRFREMDEFIELERLELEERQASYTRGKQNRNRIDLFRGVKFNC